MTAYEKAKEYYPNLWSEERVVRLAQTGRLTAAQAAEIVGHEVDIPASGSTMDKLAAAYREGVGQA